MQTIKPAGKSEVSMYIIIVCMVTWFIKAFNYHACMYVCIQAVDVCFSTHAVMILATSVCVFKLLASTKP